MLDSACPSHPLSLVLCGPVPRRATGAMPGLAGNTPTFKCCKPLDMAPGPLMHLVFHSSVAIKPHCKWLYIVMLENNNNFVNIKTIELVICLWIESGFPLPLTVHLFRPNLSPSAARTLNSALSSCLYNHTLTLALTPGWLQGFPKHLCSNSSFSQPVGEAPIRHHYSWA